MIASVIGVYFAGVVCSFVHLTIKARKQRLKYANIQEVAPHIDDNNYICCANPTEKYIEILSSTVTTLALVFPITYLVWTIVSICRFTKWSLVRSFHTLQKIGNKASDKIIAFTTRESPKLPEVDHKTYRG
jgi:hypothetical protein